MRKYGKLLLALGLSCVMTGTGVFAEEAATAESAVTAEVTAPEETGTEEAPAEETEAEAGAAESSENGIFTAIAGENGTTYENFFDVTLAEENYDLWYNCSAAVVGEAAAADTVAFMQSYISSDRYGEDAIAYYEEHADETPVFDCWYINGVKLVTFSPDNTITVELEDGSTETHTYEYMGVYPIGVDETMVYMGQEISVAFDCDVYKSTDEAGEFNYFFLRDDTMEETGHIEFRYGKDLEELQGYFVGPYAYWLTAGFDVNADADTLRSTVELFCLENMDYSSHSEEALAQIADLTGTWRADLFGLGDEYADTELYFTLDEAGHGVTMMNGEQTADFEAYKFDSGDKDDGAGIYVAYSNLEQEAEAADYTLEENENGETVLTLYAKDGTISYVKDEAAEETADEEAGAAAESADEAAGAAAVEAAGEEAEAAGEEAAAPAAGEDASEAAAPVEIATAEELAAVSENLSGDYVLTADIDLGGAEWTPIGSFVPAGEEGEEQETPSAEYAFTGTFDGGGHTISNFTINQPEGMALGLFGCADGAQIGNFTVKDASAEGTVMVSNVVGYAHASTVYDVILENGSIAVNATELSAEGMYGGIVAAGMDSRIIGCTAKADITIPEGTANAGIVGGGLELTSVYNCRAEGTITAGNNCYGLGGVSGCGFGSDAFIGCEAANVTITAGDDCRWIGGITGYSGGFADETAGVPVTIIADCSTENVSVETGANADGVNTFVGAPFFSPEAAEAMGAPFDQPTEYVLLGCTEK